MYLFIKLPQQAVGVLNPDGNKKYWNKGNRIVIKHKNNEYSAYEHFQHKGNVVRAGERVRKGQLIGYSGNTGFSYRPHLHFEVFNNPSNDESEGETLQVFINRLIEDALGLTAK